MLCQNAARSSGLFRMINQGEARSPGREFGHEPVARPPAARSACASAGARLGQQPVRHADDQKPEDIQEAALSRDAQPGWTRRGSLPVATRRISCALHDTQPAQRVSAVEINYNTVDERPPRVGRFTRAITHASTIETAATFGRTECSRSTANAKSMGKRSSKRSAQFDLSARRRKTEFALPLQVLPGVQSFAFG